MGQDVREVRRRRRGDSPVKVQQQGRPEPRGAPRHRNLVANQQEQQEPGQERRRDGVPSVQQGRVVPAVRVRGSAGEPLAGEPAVQQRSRGRPFAVLPPPPPPYRAGCWAAAEQHHFVCNAQAASEGQACSDSEVQLIPALRTQKGST